MIGVAFHDGRYTRSLRIHRGRIVIVETIALSNDGQTQGYGYAILQGLIEAQLRHVDIPGTHRISAPAREFGVVGHDRADTPHNIGLATPEKLIVPVLPNNFHLDGTAALLGPGSCWDRQERQNRGAQ